MDHHAEQMDVGQILVMQSDVSSDMVDEKLGGLDDSIEGLTIRLSDTNPVNQALMQVAAGQERLINLIEARSETTSEAGLNAESRMRLRSIDVPMLRILEEISAGRQETMTEIRTDLNALSKVFSQMRPPQTPPRRNASNKSKPEQES